MKKKGKTMTVADKMRDGTWRIMHEGGGAKARSAEGRVTKAGSAEEAQFLLACEGYTVVATSEYPEYGCAIMWTNDFSDNKLHVRDADGKWIVAWDPHYKIASFPDRNSAFEWVRNSFDGEKTFRKTSDAEYVVRFGRKT